MTEFYQEIASHVDHGVAHTSEMAQITLGIGITVVAAALILSAPASAVAIGGVTLVGASVNAAGAVSALAVIGNISMVGSVSMSFGEIIDKRSDKVVDEWIREGLDTVFLGPLAKKAARAHPTTKLSKHNHVGEGSKIVMLGPEFAPMSRRQDRTACGGTITEGLKSVVVGGRPSRKGEDIDETGSGFLKGMKLLFGLGQAAGGPNALVRVGDGVAAIAEALGNKEVSGYAKLPGMVKNPFTSLFDTADYATSISSVNDAVGASAARFGP